MQIRDCKIEITDDWVREIRTPKTKKRGNKGI